MQIQQFVIYLNKFKLLTIAGLGYIYPKNYMHSKTVQMGSFDINIIISIHISSFKKICRNVKIDRKYPWFYILKVSFSGYFLSCNNFASSCIWKFGMSTRSKLQTQPDHWKLVLDPKLSKIKSFDFVPIFLTDRVLPNQAKSLVLTLMVFPSMIASTAKECSKGRTPLSFIRWSATI